MSNRSETMKANLVWQMRTRLAVTAIMIALFASSLSFSTAAPAEAGFIRYATMTVQTGAAARSEPKLAQKYFRGWVVSDGWKNSKGQKSWVKCWKDSDWATGNYKSNRWFLAYVNHTGSKKPEWRWVHSSYVTKQSSVPRCP